MITVSESREYGSPVTAARRRSFTRAELDAFRGTSPPDLLGTQVRLLFVGITPN
jgi:hypothetical protein